MSLRSWQTIASLGLLLTTSCDPKKKFDTRVGQVSLEASAQPVITTSQSYPANTTAWPCPLNSRGTAPETPSPGFQSVGYEHRFDAGTPPAPCQWRLNHVHRLVAAFDLSSIPQDAATVHVDSAKLSFDKRHAAGDHECADKLLAVSGPGPEPGSSIRPASDDKWETAVPRLDGPACSSGRCTMDVTGQVSDWVRKVVPNQGFVLRGEDERLNANDNVSCRNEYGNFRLDVNFRHDVPAGTVPIIKPIPISTIKLTVTVASSTTKDVTYRLQWTGTTADRVDLYRDGAIIRSILNDGNELDRTRLGTTKYKVCNTGTTTCSLEIAITT
jgi:hypothetical protein